MAGETEALNALLRLLTEKGIITEQESANIEQYIYYDGS